MLTYKEQLVNSLNGLNRLALSPSQVQLASPTNPAATTSVAVYGTTTKTGERYRGKVDVSYTKLDLGILFKGIHLEWVTTATKVSEFGIWARDALGLEFGSTDLVDRTLTDADNNSWLVLSAAPDSPWYTGQFAVYYRKLAQTNPGGGGLGGFFTATYGQDYTGYGPLFRRCGGYPGADDRVSLWKVLIGVGDSQITPDDRVWIYTGEYAIVQAGGRPGFSGLLQIPTLNIWSHYNG